MNDAGRTTTRCCQGRAMRTMPAPRTNWAARTHTAANARLAPTLSGDVVNRSRLTTGAGNGLPSPPQCLHECGGFRGTRVESRGVDEDVESCAHQQFDQKNATSRGLSKPLLTRCKSRRLHHFSSVESVIYGAVPCASTVRDDFFERILSRPLFSRRLHHFFKTPTHSSLLQKLGRRVPQMNCRVECLGPRCM